MPNGTPPAYVSAAVEGVVDEAALRRIFTEVNVVPTAIYGRNGKPYLLSRLNGYNHSARFRKWVVLMDLDDDGSCAPEVLPHWLPVPAELMCLRIAVREVESWLLGDRQRLAEFLGVRAQALPEEPDRLRNPKLEMVNLASRSRKSEVRFDMVARAGSGQRVGPAYSSRLIEFIQRRDGWRPEIAAENSPSLRRSIAAIRQLAAR